MRGKLILTALIIAALFLAAIPLWYRPEGSGALRIEGKLKDVGSRTIVVSTESGDVVVELRGEYSGGLKWHQVLEKLRAHVGEEIVVEAEWRGPSLVALTLELPGRGVKF